MLIGVCISCLPFFLGVNFLFCKDLLLSGSYSWNYSLGEGNGTYKFAERS